MGLSLTIAKVLGDWNTTGLETAPNSAAAAQAVVSIGESIEELFSRERQRRAAEGKVRAVTPKHLPGYGPNKEMVLALDKALQSCGLDLRAFQPIDVLKPLAKHETRYMQELPPDLHLPGSSLLRSCIWDSRLSSGRAELPRDIPDGQIHMPSLHKALDEGSIGLPCVNFLDLHLKLRGSSTEDMWHRLFNDMRGGLQEVGLWSTACERCVVLNVTSGPYGSQSWLQTLSAAGEEFFKHRTASCHIFQALYRDHHSSSIRFRRADICLTSAFLSTWGCHDFPKVYDSSLAKLLRSCLQGLPQFPVIRLFYQMIYTRFKYFQALPGSRIVGSLYRGLACARCVS